MDPPDSSHKPDGGSSVIVNTVSDSEMPFFDLELEQLDFDHYILNTSSDTDGSIYDCSLDDSFQQIKSDLELLHNVTPRKNPTCRLACGTEPPPSVVDDDYPEIGINERFDIMKDRVRNFRTKETETLRKYIIELNSTIDLVTNSEGNPCVQVILWGKNNIYLKK